MSRQKKGGGAVPPHDLSAEQAVLSACLLSRDALDNVSNLLRPESFFSDSHRLIWSAILTASRSGAAADVVSVAGILRDKGVMKRAGGSAYLGEIVDATPSVSNVRTHANAVREFHRLREIISLCHQVASDGYSVGSNDAQSFAEKAQSQLWQIVCEGTRDRLSRVTDHIRSCYDRLEALSDGQLGALGAVSTGIKGLDRVITGWFPGDLTTLAARPGMGKTSLAMQLAMNLAHSKNDVLMLSLEMSCQQLVTRLVALNAGVDLNGLRRGDIKDVDWPSIVDASQSLSKVGKALWVDDTAAASLFEISAKARRVQSMASAESRSLKLVIVDYLQLMSPSSKEGTREQQVSEMSRGLKQMAKDLDVSVLMLSQLSRAVESRADKRPLLSDLRESGAIEQDSDNVMFLYRPGYYERGVDDGSTELIISKQRNGPTGVVPLRFYSGCTSFQEQ